MTYSVAQPVFILVPGVAVVHVHAFALDGQVLLKEDGTNQTSAPGGRSLIIRASSVGRERWGMGPPTDSLCVTDRTGTYVSMMYGRFFVCVWDPSVQAELEQSV